MTAKRKQEAEMVIVLASILLFAASGFAQPIGYDENTEITVVGTVTNPMVVAARALAAFTLRSSSGRNYRVYVAPRWYLEEIRLRFKRGEKVKVIGSKFFGRDGSRCLVARSIVFPARNEQVILRDSALRPVWHGAARPHGSCMKIFLPRY